MWRDFQILIYAALFPYSYKESPQSCSCSLSGVQKMISIIIPAYNEEENILRIDTELTPVLYSLGSPYELLLINDGSKDHTEEYAKLLKNPYVKIISHASNQGLGRAVRTGIQHAQGEFLVLYEADFTWNPEYIKQLLEAQKKYQADCVIGSHFHKQGKLQGHGKYSLRIFLSKGVNFLYQILLGSKIASISSLFRVYRAESIKKLMLTSTGFNINAEILVKLLRNKAKIIEVPVILTKRKFGKSKINLVASTLNHLILLSKVIQWKLFKG